MKGKFRVIWRVSFALVLGLSVGFVVTPVDEVSAASMKEEFATNTTFEVPEGVTKITVEAWGGGGAGGGSNNITDPECMGSCGAGGGGGAYASSNLSVTKGQTFYIIVGLGGIGVSGANGTNGYPSFVGPNTNREDALVLAAGGSGGAASIAYQDEPQGGPGGRAINCTGDISFNGTDGKAGNTTGLCCSGAGGDGAYDGGPGGEGICYETGPYAINTRNGNNGTAPGGGGGGGRTSCGGVAQAGGNGGDGKVVITWEAPDKYNLTTAVTPPGSGTATDLTNDSPYLADTVVNISAAANPCYEFVNWTATPSVTFGNETALTTNFTMPADNVTVTAHFREICYYLTMMVSPTGSGTATDLTNNPPYLAGTVVNINAVANPCYEFVNWTATPAVTFGNETAPATNFTMPAQNVTVTAHFKDICPPTPPAMPPPCGFVYGLKISSTEGGSVTKPGEGLLPYNAGTVVHLEASPDAGHSFLYWSGDTDSIADVYDASTTITMDDWYIITANFNSGGGTAPPGSSVQYDLTTSSTTGGSVTNPGEGTFTYDEGEAVSLVASPDTSYKFDEWTGDVGTIADVYDASTTITMNGDYSITANFEELSKYDLTTSSTTGGAVTNPGEGTFTYDEGDAVNLVASPDTSYKFVGWTGDVSTIANPNSALTSITINGDYSITANFEINTASPSGEPLFRTGCFIATAAYGTPTAEQIDVLREFRDMVLLESTVGSQFVTLYYQYSPPVADFIAGSDLLRTLVRELLIDPLVWVVEATGAIWQN